VSLTIADAVDAPSDSALSEARQVLRRIVGITDVIYSGSGLTAYGNNGALLVPEIVRALDNAQLKIGTISVSTPTLDDVFLKHTGRSIRSEGNKEINVEQKKKRSFFGRKQEVR
jgi:ABC-2 type transport system ATP-binding protein